MAFVEENWQMKRSTITERTSFIFNKEILSDVKFVVPVSTGESESKKVIPAHKFVLAISSPVFFAMFYGQMAETTDSIELPDCEYESLLELFRYLYSDELKLSGNNVMQVLYLANKYMVPSLAKKCNEYLRDNLKTSNVFCILPQAQKFDDKELKERCWEVIEKQTEEAVTSDEFVTVERSVVETIVKRERLNVKEVELFKAVDRWATKESGRQGITADGDAKRRILGEEIVKAIRFPLMSEKEFASVVIDCDILTLKEVGAMVKHFNDVLTSPLPFGQAPRVVPLTVFRFQRFEIFKSPGYYCWDYSASSADCIHFTVNKTITLLGIQHFGSKGSEYTVSTEVRDTTDDSSLVKQSGTYVSEKDKTYDYYGFDVRFDRPVCLADNKEYKLVSQIKGPKSWYGEDGKTSVECQGVRFIFRSSPLGFYSSYRISETSGQFPAFLLS
ncbi:BTB/POZ domain-containing protein 6-like [Oculina patagonica]